MSEIFSRSRLTILPLSERKHDLDLSVIISPRPSKSVHENFEIVAERIIQAKNSGAAVVFMMGAHVIRSGAQRYIIDLMERGYISCIAMNGACVVHDFEFALLGKTTENVERYIRKGQFGLWQELGEINEIVFRAALKKAGLGTSIGKAIEKKDYPHKDISIFATGYRLGIPLTVHVGIGYDIVHEHPNCDGAAWGSTSYMDFLIFAKVLESLEGGVAMNFGSAVMAPEIFLKALAMARNVALKEKREINKFTTLVCDLYPLPDDFHVEAPKNTPEYFFRPYKTMLVRTISDGGESFYVRGDHSHTIPQLWTAIINQIT